MVACMKDAGKEISEMGKGSWCTGTSHTMTDCGRTIWLANISSSVRCYYHSGRPINQEGYFTDSTAEYIHSTEQHESMNIN